MPRSKVAPSAPQAWKIARKGKPTQERTRGALAVRIDAALLADLRGLQASENRERTLRGERLVQQVELVEEALRLLLVKRGLKPSV